MVEVLCVIGIVLIVGSLAWPRVAAVRARSRSVETLSAMRHLGMLYQTYADAHRGFVATLFAPVYRAPTDPPERIDLEPGAYIESDWFGNAHWSWLAIDPEYPRAALLAGGHPWRHRRLGLRPISSDFSLTSCLFASREYWDPATQTGTDQWGAQNLHTVAYPSDKGLLMQMKTYVLPGWPDGHPACCFEHIKTGILWADLSGSEEYGSDLTPGVPNPWSRLAVQGATPWYHGPPVLQTRGGLGGRDR